MASIYFRNGSTWIQATKVYKKISGAWVEQTNLSSVLENDTKYLPSSKLSYLTDENHNRLVISNNRILIYSP